MVVDDGRLTVRVPSPNQLAREHAPRVLVLHRESKSGRGGAVMAGFREALKTRTTGGSRRWMPTSPTSPRSCRPSAMPLQTRTWWWVRGTCLAARSRAGRSGGGSGAAVQRHHSRSLGVPMRDFTNGYRIYSRRAVEHLTRGSCARLATSPFRVGVHHPSGRHDHHRGSDGVHQSAAGRVEHVGIGSGWRAEGPRPHARAPTEVQLICRRP